MESYLTQPGRPGAVTECAAIAPEPVPVNVGPQGHILPPLTVFSASASDSPFSASVYFLPSGLKEITYWSVQDSCWARAEASGLSGVESPKFPERWGSPGCHSPPFSKKPHLLGWLYKFLFMLASSLNKSPLPVARPLLFILCSPGGGGYCGSPPCQLEPKILSLTLTLAHPPWVRLSSCPCIRCGVYSHVLLCVAPGLALSILTRGWSSSRLPSLPLPAQILLLVTVVGWMMTL